MIFTSVEIQNFLRFKTAVVQLKNQGLVLVNGVNHDSSAADSNGAGKSTIFEAIVWCLWGKTVRGYSGDRVINNQVGKDCWVRLKIEHEGEEYSIERYRKHSQYRNELHFMHYTEAGPADMTEGTPTMTQQLLTDWLGIDFDTYIRGPMVGQGNFKRFSQMTDAEQKSVLEIALQLSVLSEAHEVAKNKAKELQLEMSQAEFAYGSHKEQRTHLTNLLEHSEDEYQAALRKYRANMRRVYSSVVAAVLKAEHAEDQLDELPELDLLEAESLLKRLEGLQEHQQEIQYSAMQELQEKSREHHLELRSKQTILRGHQDALEQFRSTIKVGQRCPTCMQETTQEHHQACMEELVGKISSAEAEVELAQLEHRKACQAVDALTEEHASQKVATAAILDKAQERVREAKIVHDRTEYWLRDIEEAERYRDEEVDKFQWWKETALPTDQSDRIQAELDDIEKQIHQLGEQYLSLKDQFDYLDFWTKGFGNSGLKSLILDSIVPFLNDRARLYARDLTDGEVKIEFSTKTKLKSGEMREKFQVLTTNVNGAEDYDGSSGGERARIDLAINFALSDLMAARAKKAFPQRFFDEPFEGVDEAGLEAVMDLLSKMTQTCGTIFVVTHKPALASLFNKVITVHKKNGESFIDL